MVAWPLGDGSMLAPAGSGRPTSKHLQGRPPGRILGQEAGPGLLQAAQGLVQGGPEGAVDGHDFTGRLHL